MAMVGVGGLVGALVINNQLADESNAMEAAAAAGDRAVYERRLDDLQDKQTLGRALLFGGGAFVAVGTTLFIYDLSDTESATDAGGGQLTLRVAPLLQTPGVSVDIRF